MAKKKSKAPANDVQKIAGKSVQILQTGNQEQLMIDGRPCRFHKSPAGYVLMTNVYAEPQKTLLDAVKLGLKETTD